MLQRVDLAFSRDQAERIYVQQRLREQTDAVQAWWLKALVSSVCGSAEGMAPAVDSALEILGAAVVSQLIEQDRYRRDVY